TTRPDIDGDVAKRLATDGHIRDCNRRPRRAGERAARAESKGRADVNPLGLDACRGRVGLIEQTPAVLMPTAEQGAVGFGPSQLQIDLRSAGVERRYCPATDGFVLKNSAIVGNDDAG